MNLRKKILKRAGLNPGEVTSECHEKGDAIIDINENLYEAQAHFLDGHRNQAIGAIDTAVERAREAQSKGALSESAMRDWIGDLKDLRKLAWDFTVGKEDVVQEIKNLRWQATSMAFNAVLRCME